MVLDLSGRVIIWLPILTVNISEIWYVACCTAHDGVYACEHKHPTVREAMNCIIPDGGSFIRAFDSGVFRSLDNKELIDFLESLREMPWSSRNKAQRGTSAVSTPADVR
jgi:hypothetical protein